MSPAEPTAPDASTPVVGVNLAGYFDSALGLGEAARQVKGALEAAGTPIATFGLRGHSASELSTGATAPPLADRGPYPVNLVCANAEASAAVLDELGLDFFEERRTVGMWWWELDSFPESYARAFDHLDEVWVGSRFVADVLAPVSPVPVVRVPLPVARPRPAAVDRAALGLPEGLLFLFVFDYASVFERKNPLAVVEAFARTFPAGSGASLVLKCLGSNSHRAEHERLLTAAKGHPDVRVIDTFLAPEKKAALMAACDCYVSLHRSEGFGLTIAEAVLLDKPVIATGYSGPMDYLSPSTARLVDYTLVPVGEGNEPYPADGRWAEPDIDHAARLMREVADDRAGAAALAMRARESFEREHAPRGAAAAMLRRLAVIEKLPSRSNGYPAGLDTSVLERQIWSPGAPPAGSRGGGLRGLARRTLLRAIKPHAVQQRLVDEEILRALRTLDERIQGLASAQATLQAEISARRDADA